MWSVMSQFCVICGKSLVMHPQPEFNLIHDYYPELSGLYFQPSPLSLKCGRWVSVNYWDWVSVKYGGWVLSMEAELVLSMEAES